MKQSRLILTVLAFGYAFLYIPLVSVVFYSFNDSKLATVWGGFSTRWYGELFRNEQILDAALLSLQQLIGWPGQRGFTTITIAHTTFAMAYVAVVVRSRLMAMDESLEEAAMDLGCGPLRVLFDITLPLIAPAMLAGWLLAFTLSLDDLVIASFVSGPGASTLPMYIFSKVKLGVTPDINALASILILIVTIGLLAAWVAMSRRRS